MGEPTHGDILKEVGELKSEVGHLAATVSSMKKSIDEWQAMKAGAGIARWIVATCIVALAMIAGLFKAVAG